MDDVAGLGGEVVARAPVREAAGEDYRRRSRRSWTIEEKLAIVREAEGSGDPVAEVARRHGLNANHLFNWLQRYRDGTLDRGRLRGRANAPQDFLDLGVVGAGASGAGTIEIELPDRARIRFGATIGAETLHRVLMAIKAVL